MVYDFVETENEVLLKERAYTEVRAEFLQFLGFSPFLQAQFGCSFFVIERALVGFSIGATPPYQKK